MADIILLGAGLFLSGYVITQNKKIQRESDFKGQLNEFDKTTGKNIYYNNDAQDLQEITLTGKTLSSNKIDLDYSYDQNGEKIERFTPSDNRYLSENNSYDFTDFYFSSSDKTLTQFDIKKQENINNFDESLKLPAHEKNYVSYYNPEQSKNIVSRTDNGNKINLTDSKNITGAYTDKNYLLHPTQNGVESNTLGATSTEATKPVKNQNLIDPLKKNERFNITGLTSSDDKMLLTDKAYDNNFFDKSFITNNKILSSNNKKNNYGPYNTVNIANHKDTTTEYTNNQTNKVFVNSYNLNKYQVLDNNRSQIPKFNISSKQENNNENLNNVYSRQNDVKFYYTNNRKSTIQTQQNNINNLENKYNDHTELKVMYNNDNITKPITLQTKTFKITREPQVLDNINNILIKQNNFDIVNRTINIDSRNNDRNLFKTINFYQAKAGFTNEGLTPQYSLINN